MEREELKTRVREWGAKIGILVPAIHIRQMRSKWASISTDGRLTLNSELLGLRPELCDYVIVHELLHLRAPNHGKLWKSLMHAYLPEWVTFEEALREKNRLHNA